MKNIHIFVCFFLTSTAALVDQSFQLPTWMGDLNNIIGNRPLTKVVIPATHDSASDKIGGPDTAIAQGGEVPQIANLALPIINEFSKAQDLSIYNQLMNGVRALDLRIGFRDQKKMAGIFFDEAKDLLGFRQPAGVKDGTTYYFDYYTHHGVYSEVLTAVLSEIKRFLEEHPKEIIIISLGNLINMNEGRHNDLVSKMRDYLNVFIADRSMKPTTTINELLRQNKRVILIHDNSSKANAHNIWYGNIFDASDPTNTICRNTWPNKQKASDLITHLKERVPDRIENPDQKTKCEGRLWNTSLTLTPPLETIASSANILDKNRITSLKQLDGTIDKKAFLEWIKANKFNPNIVSVDFITDKIAREIISLNFIVAAN